MMPSSKDVRTRGRGIRQTADKRTGFSILSLFAKHRHNVKTIMTAWQEQKGSGKLLLQLSQENITAMQCY